MREPKSRACILKSFTDYRKFVYKSRLCAIFHLFGAASLQVQLLLRPAYGNVLSLQNPFNSLEWKMKVKLTLQILQFFSEANKHFSMRKVARFSPPSMTLSGLLRAVANIRARLVCNLSLEKVHLLIKCGFYTRLYGITSKAQSNGLKELSPQNWMHWNLHRQEKTHPSSFHFANCCGTHLEIIQSDIDTWRGFQCAQLRHDKRMFSNTVYAGQVTALMNAGLLRLALVQPVGTGRLEKIAVVSKISPSALAIPFSCCNKQRNFSKKKKKKTRRRYFILYNEERSPPFFSSFSPWLSEWKKEKSYLIITVFSW